MVYIDPSPPRLISTNSHTADSQTPKTNGKLKPPSWRHVSPATPPVLFTLFTDVLCLQVSSKTAVAELLGEGVGIAKDGVD